MKHKKKQKNLDAHFFWSLYACCTSKSMAKLQMTPGNVIWRHGLIQSRIKILFDYARGCSERESRHGEKNCMQIGLIEVVIQVPIVPPPVSRKHRLLTVIHVRWWNVKIRAGKYLKKKKRQKTKHKVNMMRLYSPKQFLTACK